MLLIQWVGLPEPHQTAEQQQRPEDLNEETHLDEEEFSPTQTFLPQHEDPILAGQPEYLLSPAQSPVLPQQKADLGAALHGSEASPLQGSWDWDKPAERKSQRDAQVNEDLWSTV